MPREIDPGLAALLQSIGTPVETLFHDTRAQMQRPATPDTMLGLPCAEDHDTEIAIGDVMSETGYNENGLMTLVVTTPTSQLAAVLLTKKQVRQLRDYLSTKL